MRRARREEKPKSGFLMEVKAADKWGSRSDGSRRVWGVFRIIFWKTGCWGIYPWELPSRLCASMSATIFNCWVRKMGTVGLGRRVGIAAVLRFEGYAKEGKGPPLSRLQVAFCLKPMLCGWRNKVNSPHFLNYAQHQLLLILPFAPSHGLTLHPLILDQEKDQRHGFLFWQSSYFWYSFNILLGQIWEKKVILSRTFSVFLLLQIGWFGVFPAAQDWAWFLPSKHGHQAALPLAFSLRNPWVHRVMCLRTCEELRRDYHKALPVAIWSPLFTCSNVWGSHPEISLR